MKAIKPLDGLHIAARRWFDRTAGNTYHSVRIYANNSEVAHLPFQYGYGEHWLQTAFDWLEAQGYIERPHFDNGSTEYGTVYLRERLNGTYNLVDVTRKRDL